MRLQRSVFCAVKRFVVLGTVVCALCAPLPVWAKGTLPAPVQAGINALLEAKGKKAHIPNAAALAPLLEYSLSPLNHAAGGEELYPAPRSAEGQGIFWRSKVNVPFATLLQYISNPNVPNEAIYPAALRRNHWLPGSDILTVDDLWTKKVDKDHPIVLHGAEFEEITPDTFSGAYYSYTQDRLILLTEYEGQKVQIAVNWQRGPSSVGKKAATIGKYENWDYVYSGAKGTLASGIGWAETNMYASVAVIVFYETAPGSNQTGYALYKWLKAGWSSMNMVKRHHIRDGAIRSFNGLKAFMESPKRPAAEDIAAYAKSLQALDEAALRKRFAPYSAKIAELGATNDVLKTDDFQKVINNGAYGNHLKKEELIAALMVSYVKQTLGKPLLAGPLE